MNAGIHIKKVIMFYCTDWELWKVLGASIALLLSILLKVIFPAIGLLLLVLLDMRFGVKKYVKSQKDNGVELKSERSYRNIQSGGVRKTFSKIGDYLTVILVFVIFEAILEYMGVNLKYQNFTLSNFVVLLLCINELKSLDENIRKLQGISLLRSVLDFVFRRKPVSEKLLLFYVKQIADCRALRVDKFCKRNY